MLLEPALVFVTAHHDLWLSFPSDPPSEEGSPGEVRSRCPSAASLATGPENLSQRGQPAGPGRLYESSTSVTDRFKDIGYIFRVR